jgi:hypothetical protein
MYLTGYYGWYWLGDYWKQTSSSRSVLKCHNAHRNFYRSDDEDNGCGFLLSD